MFLDKICDTPNKSILLGDFNLHLDQPDKSDTNRFCTTLENSGLINFHYDKTKVLSPIILFQKETNVTTYSVHSIYVYMYSMYVYVVFSLN